MQGQVHLFKVNCGRTANVLAAERIGAWSADPIMVMFSLVSVLTPRHPLQKLYAFFLKWN